MKIYHIFIVAAGASLLGGCTSCDNKKMQAADYVNVFVGTDAHGHTYPGAATPFGMVQLSPDTGLEGWDRCSGYHYSDSTIIGFSHTHLSGTGRSDLMDVMLMPFTGETHWNAGTSDNPDAGYRSRFSHDSETARPGYYAVTLDDYGIRAELTASKRTGMHRYTFPADSPRKFILDLSHHYSTDSVLNTTLTVVTDTLITGSRETLGWGEPGEKFYSHQKIFFAIKLQEVPENIEIRSDGKSLQCMEAHGRDIKMTASFAPSAAPLGIKVGISPVSVGNAIENMEHEIPGWDFDTTAAEALTMWNEALGKIEAKGSGRDMRVFYTALYHSMLAPVLYNDINGQYRGSDGEIHKASGFNNYTVLSLWDTFRAANPLYTIIEPQLVSDIINSMLAQYDEYGLLPVWPLWSSETNCMIGYHAVPVIVDAVGKGIGGFDVEKAYCAMRNSAMQDDFGVGELKKYGFIPRDRYNRSVSTALEYAYDDWCIANLARKLEKDDDADYFEKRSKSYMNYFDPEYKLMNGRAADGSFRRPFDPFFSSYGECDWVEGNSWQYSFFVPHDVEGLAGLFGGHAGLSRALDSLFTISPELTGDAPIDITGLIGQYAHGNEPSHHIAYLYDYIGDYPKAQQRLRQIMTELYSDTPDGLCGNEDCGQMSAWYVLSAMGFYPVNPADGVYMLGVPMLEEAKIKSGTKTFTMRAIGYGPDKPYVKSIRLNGKPYNKLFITHDDITEGATLEFEMSGKAAHPAEVLEVSPGVFHLSSAGMSADIDANTGGRVVSLRCGDSELLTGPDVHPKYYGATLWPSPQAAYWPVRPTLDSKPYSASADCRSLTLKSATDSLTGLAFTKIFTVCPADTSICLKYIITNNGNTPRDVAAWDVVRVRGGETSFKMTDTVAGCGSRFDKTERAGTHILCRHDTSVAADTPKQKLFAISADGKYSHRSGNIVFSKEFPKVPESQLPPLQGEVEVFIAPGGLYSELETHGPLRNLTPGDTLHYDQRWRLRRL